MALLETEVVSDGRGDQPVSRAARWRRSLARLVAPLALLAAGGAVLWEWQPWVRPPETGVRLLVVSAEQLRWLDVDSGDRTPVPVERGWTDPVVVSDGVVVQYPSADPELADRVVGYRAGEPPNEVGEADRVLPVEGSGVWLAVDGDAPTGPAVVLTTAFGQWRSRVFTLPPRTEVVGATADGLVVTRGPFRYRGLQLWDVQLGERITGYGLVVGVRDVDGGRALVTTGCLTSGCSTAVIDLRDGDLVEVEPPAGFVESGPPRLVPGGVAVPVTDRSGAAQLVVGPPDSPVATDLGAVELARGAGVLPTEDGWLVVPTADGDVVLWRADTDRLPLVDLRRGEQVIGVSG